MESEIEVASRSEVSRSYSFTKGSEVATLSEAGRTLSITRKVPALGGGSRRVRSLMAQRKTEREAQEHRVFRPIEEYAQYWVWL